MSEALVRKWFDAFEADDWETVKGFYADDSVFVEVPTGQTYKGVEENLAQDQGWKAMMSDLRPQYNNVIESGNTVVCEMTMTGTMTGEMEMPDGTKVPPTNKTATVDVCMITEWNGGKMSKGTMYMDMMTFLQGLGVMPAEN